MPLLPLPSPYVRTTMRWQLPGNEIAETTTSWTNGGSTFFPVAEDFAARGINLWNAIRGNYRSTTTYLGMKIAYLDVNSQSTSTDERYVAPVLGTGGGNAIPVSCSLVASLRSLTAGRSGRGRMYLPGPSTIGLDIGTARLLPATATTFATAMSAFLADFAAGPTQSCVASRTTGQFYVLNRVEVGDVIDTQRRRRDDLLETYVTSGIA